MFLKNAKTPLIRAAARFLAIALILSVTAIPAVAATQAPVLTNGAGATYSDGGMTFVSSDTDVFITPAVGSAYYYALGKLVVDVYYNGADNDPIGSYFSGKLENGALAANIAVDVNSQSGAPVTEASGWKITVPKPERGVAAELQVVAYSGAEVSPVYTHTFYAADSIIVADGEGRAYASGGTTGTDQATDLYLTNKAPGEKYAYTFDDFDTVDAYYAGADGMPKGSYFEGPLFNGAYVATLDGVANWEPVADDGKISVPAPPIYDTARYNLSIRDVLNNIVFTHTFKWFYSSSASFGDTVTAEFRNDTESAFKGHEILAVYDSKGRLAYSEQIDIDAAPGAAVSMEFGLDVSRYPAGEYRYAVYCWDSNYVPVAYPVEK